MTARLPTILFAIVIALAAVDTVWASAGHFDIDAQAYGLLALLTAALAAGGVFYDRVRKDERLAAMLFATGFLIGMSAGFSVLNYLLLTVAGPRIDTSLAAIDRAMGVDWPALMAFVAHYPVTNMVLQLVYISVLPQIALLVVALGFKGRPEQIYALCLSIAAGAAIAIFVWTLAPSFGAFSVYDLPPAVASHLVLALDGHYAKELIHLLATGPGRISPSQAQGLIGFPSYHAVLALLVVWHARKLPVIRWVALSINLVVLIATPIQGGHHVVDVLAGFAVAALAILLADSVLRLAARTGAPLPLKTQPASL
ncbi:MAG TPA: phosphatase PAP2 family protein [Rhizomicrobium sp.]|nr:phosphatase PAP2 family protein [Rhizomicrobium sp.]